MSKYWINIVKKQQLHICRKPNQHKDLTPAVSTVVER